MTNQESKRSVTIEDLLRVKRAERPKAEFWADFDRELRAKQLAALVEKTPWWRTWPRALRGIGRYQLPLGATAVLAVTLLSLRSYQTSQRNSHLVLPDMSGVASESTATPEATKTLAMTETPQEAPASVEDHSAQSSPATLTLSSEATSPGELARMVPLLSAQDTSVTQGEIRPSTKSIEENRAMAEAMLGMPSSSFEVRALPTRTTPTEPLAQMSNPAETRRSRFAAAFAAAALNSSSSPAPTTRVARRLSDEQLYDSIHRFGASGNSVSFRF